MVELNYPRLQQSMLSTQITPRLPPGGLTENSTWNISTTAPDKTDVNMTSHKPVEELQLLDILQIATNSAGIVFLLVTFCAYIVSSKERTPGGYCIINMCAALAISQIVLMFSMDKTEWPILCKITGGLAEYFWLAAFFWANCVVIHNWWIVNYYVTQKRETRIYIVYMFFSWFIPLIIVSVTFTFDIIDGISPKPGVGDTMCFISNPGALVLFLIAPCLFLLFISLMLLAATCMQSCTKSTENSYIAQDANVTLKWSILIEFLMDAALLSKFWEMTEPSLESKIVSMSLFFIEGAIVFLTLVVHKGLLRNIFRCACCCSRENNSAKYKPIAKGKTDTSRAPKTEIEPIPDTTGNNGHAAIYSKHHPYIRIARDTSSSTVPTVAGTYSRSSSSSAATSPRSGGTVSFDGNITHI